MEEKYIGELRLLQEINRYEFAFEADIMRDGLIHVGGTTGSAKTTQVKNWEFRNLDRYYKTFAGRPVLVAYIGKRVGDGHNSSTERDENGDEYESYMAPTAERIVGMISEDEKDLTLIERDGFHWIRVRGRIWRTYAKELTDKIVRTGRMSVSVETNVIENRVENEVEIMEVWDGMGLSILGDGVPPAVPGANIRALAALQQDFEDMKLRVAALREEDENKPQDNGKTQKTNKGVRHRMNKTLEKELAAKFPEYMVIGASDDGLNVALMSKNGAETFSYSFSPEDKGAVLSERITPVNLSLAMPIGDNTIDIDFQRMMEKSCADAEKLASENAELREKCEKLEAEAEAAKARETARRIKASGDAAVAQLAEINANRAEAEKFEDVIIDDIKRRAEAGGFVSCVDDKGEWCGEAEAKKAVRDVCMTKQMEQDKARAETARNASRKSYAFEPGFMGGAKADDGLAGLYQSMVNG